MLRLKNQQQMFLCCVSHGSGGNKRPLGKGPSETLTGIHCIINGLKF